MGSWHSSRDALYIAVCITGNPGLSNKSQNMAHLASRVRGSAATSNAIVIPLLIFSASRETASQHGGTLNRLSLFVSSETTFLEL
jgi:hypothetical protein